MVEVWGIASGCGSTKEAARGAFTWRRYDTKNIPRQDWLVILTIKNLQHSINPGRAWENKR